MAAILAEYGAQYALAFQGIKVNDTNGTQMLFPWQIRDDYQEVSSIMGLSPSAFIIRPGGAGCQERAQAHMEYGTPELFAFQEICSPAKNERPPLKIAQRFFSAEDWF